MFEITADDIARLDDENLRAVVARLCEAEVRSRGLSASCVTWGGNQTAADGGIDVRVALPAGTIIDGFIPSAATGFQVKKQDMPHAEILREMRPNGVIRPSIQGLADEGGVYIIVSSDGSTADTALQRRRDAMEEAMKGVLHADALKLDFYDRTRIATWVRTHEGLIPWARTLVGRAIPGWQSYGAWAYAPLPVGAVYLFDEKLRVHPSKRETENGFSALDGIRLLREQLRQERHVVRLVGLSGVGKTRLAQALFDGRVGKDSLNPDLAIYTNMADGPEPQPVGVASSLVASTERAILVIDNCSPDLHQRLSEVCRDHKSRVSVITIEYDIREDIPEGTEVFTLQSSSPELIVQMLRQRFPNVSEIDARTVAEFSGGNARIAIGLAGTIERNGTISGLTDEQLFQRLFEQRHAPDAALYLAAQACSLVYSFQGEDVSDDEQAELKRLGKLIGQSPHELYRQAAELQRRDLVQQRGSWRAVLPHAIANRLAGVALQNIPYATIQEQLLTSERLRKSFSRRLSYLHTSKEAVAIVKKWLGVGGLLADVAHLDELGATILENVAPVAPAEILAALERGVLAPHAADAALACKKHLNLLRSIAYEPALFERCTTLMVTILTAEEVDKPSNGTELFASLFHLCLSGTHATIEQRLAVIKALLDAPDRKRRALGVEALQGVLEAWDFFSTCSFEFGGHSRDYGFWPRTTREVQHWFREGLNLVAAVAYSDTPVAAPARVAFADHFRILWLKAGVPDELVAACRSIREAGFWPEGWRAVRQTLDAGGKGLAPERLAKLSDIEAQLRPTDLLQKVQAVVLTKRLQGVDVDDFEDHADDDIITRMARTESLAQDLGAAVATDDAVLTALLPEVVSSDGRLWSLGQGLCKGAPEAEKLWDRLVSALAATEAGRRKPQVLLGFLHELRTRTPVLAARLLGNAVEHETLSQYYPSLQVASDIEEADVARLKRSLKVGKAPAAIYVHLAYGRAAEPIPAPDLKELILGIAAMPSGYDVAIEILHMRLYAHEQRKEAVPAELADTGRELVRRLAFTKKNDREDYRIGAIVKSCLAGEQGILVVTELCSRLKDAVKKYETYAFYHDDLLDGLFSVQPIAALDALCAGNEKELEQGTRIINEVGNRRNPLGFVSEQELLTWCDQDPAVRYPAIARCITITQSAGEAGPLRWAPLARHLFARAPDKREVLKQFISQFMPSGVWGGSLSAILEAHTKLLDDLEVPPDLAGFIGEEKSRLRAAINVQQRSETELDKQRDERFE